MSTMQLVCAFARAVVGIATSTCGAIFSLRTVLTALNRLLRNGKLAKIFVVKK